MIMIYQPSNWPVIYDLILSENNMNMRFCFEFDQKFQIIVKDYKNFVPYTDIFKELK